MINFSFFGIIFTYLLNICQSYFISVFSVFYFYIMCFIFGKILSASCLYILRRRIFVFFYVCIDIFRSKYLRIQDLIFSCSFSLQIFYNIMDRFITDLIAGLRSKRYNLSILDSFQRILLGIYGNN